MSDQVEVVQSAEPVNPIPPSAPARRRRRISLIVISLGAIVLFVIAVLVIPGLLKGSHSGPIAVDVYPGATLVNDQSEKLSKRQLYASYDSIDKVFEFYNNRLPKDEVSGCRRIYIDAKPSDEVGHWYGQCVVDNSMLDTTQHMTITINYQTLEGTTDPRTYFLIDQAWGRN